MLNRNLTVVIIGLIVLFGNTLGHANPVSKQVTFKSFGKTVQTLDIEQLERKVYPVLIEVLEPHTDKNVTYSAFPMWDLLKKIYSTPSLKKDFETADEILFTCSDGYQPSVPKQLFEVKKAFFAYGEKGNPEFKLYNKFQNETVYLGPFYLVWDNLHDEELKTMGGNYWPYQVVAVDLISFKDKFPKIAPPADASEKVRRGFLAFRNHCMNCHSLNGEGGKKSPVDFNQPSNIMDRYPKDLLERRILNPASINPATTMPALNIPNPAAAGPHRTIEALFAYFEAMKSQKR